MELNKTNRLEKLQPSVPLGMVLVLLALVAVGTFAVSVALPAWLPQLSQSLLGDAPKAYWYLSRASAFAAYGLLWLSMMFGLLITNKLARMWPGGPTAFDLHQYTSLLGLGFIVFHVLILLGDHYINYTLTQLLIPFGSENFQTLWVGVGQIGFYLLALVSFTFYIRHLITQRGFRVIHFLSFAAFAMALVHGLWSGTDASSVWASGLYWVSAASVVFLTVYRIFSKWVEKPAVAARAG